MLNPIFSVIIPTYNRAERLKIALESLSVQTYKNFEVFVCDDGSTDHTKEIVETFKEKLDLTYIWEENWGGPARPRNNGIKAAKGEWVCFLDSDDWWYSNKLEILNEFISNNPDTDFVCHELVLNNILTGERRLMTCRPVVPDLYRELLISGNRFINSASSIKRSFLQKFKIEINESKKFVSVEDFEFCLQLAACNANFACINVPLGEYLLETDNISNSQFHLRNLESVLKFHVFEKQTFEPNKKRLWSEVSCRLNIYRGNLALQKGNYQKSFTYHLIAMKKSPGTFFKRLYHKISE